MIFKKLIYHVLRNIGINVRVLKEKDRILYDKLVRLAGGDSGIVI
jgi:hypothetical protein